MNSRGSGTLWGTIATILLVMALFYGTFNYVSVNYQSSGITENSVYDQSIVDLETSQDELETNINEVKSKVGNITEASSLALVAWNGLTGVAAVLRTFFSIVQISIDVWNAVLPGLSFLPDWTKVLIEMALIIWVVLIIFGAFKGESKT